MNPEPLLIAWLSANFPAVRACTELPADLDSALPVVQVAAAPGQDTPGAWGGSLAGITTRRADLYVIGSGRPAARDLAEQIYPSIFDDLPGFQHDDAVVIICGDGSGPYELPDQNTNIRRFLITFALRLQAI